MCSSKDALTLAQQWRGSCSGVCLTNHASPVRCQSEIHHKVIKLGKSKPYKRKLRNSYPEGAKMIADPEEDIIDYFAGILTLVSKITIKLRITNESFSNLASSLKHLASLLGFVQTNGGRRGEVLSQCTYRKKMEEIKIVSVLRRP